MGHFYWKVRNCIQPSERGFCIHVFLKGRGDCSNIRRVCVKNSQKCVSRYSREAACSNRIQEKGRENANATVVNREDEIENDCENVDATVPKNVIENENGEENSIESQ